MSWALGFDILWNRDIGYGVPAYCDHPHCGKEIDRGLSHVCGSEPYGGDRGCGLYFCGEHLFPALCERCCEPCEPPFTPSADHPTWIEHKATHESWARWRVDQEL